MTNKWLNIRESAVSLLRIFAVLVVLFLLSRVGIQVFTQVDDGNIWYNILSYNLYGLAVAAYYGGIIFALSWIVSLIGKQTEENVRSGWLHNRESAVSLLKILSLSIVLIYLPVIGIQTFVQVDGEETWYNLVNVILGHIILAAYYGGTIFALSWIVSLIGNRNEENVKSGWLNDKESAVSLLRIFALLIVLLSLPLAVIQKFIWTDWGLYWGWEMTADSIFYVLYTAAYQGGIIFALSWIVSLIGQRDADEVPDENIT